MGRANTVNCLVLFGLLLNLALNLAPIHAYANQSEANGEEEQGYIILVFDVTPDGAVDADTITVLETSAETLKGPAVSTVSRWKYKPTVVDGEKVWQRGVRVRFSIRPEQE